MPTVLTEPAPAVDAAWAARVLEETYGRDATIQELRSERDRNFLATAADGWRAVLKVSNSAEDREVVGMENAAMDHVARVDPELAIPRLVRCRDGRTSVEVRADDGRLHAVRMVSVLPGAAADTAPLPIAFADDLGRWSARLEVALRGFFHPAGNRAIAWDPRRVHELRPYTDRLEPDRRRMVEEFLDRLDDLGERTAGLPAGVLHADVTMSNVLVDDQGITGLIDFGDMHHTARACDLAITLASLLRVVMLEGLDPWASTAALLEGYQRLSPLEPAEVDLLGELVLARLVATVLISAWRAPDNPENVDYLTGLDEGSWRMLDLLREPSVEALSGRLHRICGTGRLASAQQPDRTLLDRRRAVLGGDLSPLFYREPLHMVRGDGPWLIASDGRRYLDAYNNVAVVGHEHPTVVRAITGQAALLNTNSRYLHAGNVELAERIVATMPDELDTCIFVNSGSEANDLAWRLATTWTGRSGAIVTNCSYHGVSAATSPLSSNTWPVGYRPVHVAVFEPPYRSADEVSPTRSRLGHGSSRRRPSSRARDTGPRCW